MSINEIKALAAAAAADKQEITVTTLIGERLTGICTFAGTNKFRVDHVMAATFFQYDEVESVE